MSHVAGCAVDRGEEVTLEGVELELLTLYA